MARWSRRSFLGGVVAGLVGFFGGKARSQVTAAASAPRPDSAPLCEEVPTTSTTISYDCDGNVVTAWSCESITAYTTCTYDAGSRVVTCTDVFNPAAT
jgi:hypothetical protein